MFQFSNFDLYNLTKFCFSGSGDASVSSKFERKKASFQEELDDILTKTVKLMEKKLGRKFSLFQDTNDTAVDDDEPDEEHECDETSMKLTQDKCTVRSETQ